MIAVFFIDKPLSLLLCGAAVFAAGLAAGLSFLFMWRSLRIVWLLALCSFLFNIFLVDGNALISFAGLQITDSGVTRGCVMALRLFILVLVTSLLSYTTSPILLTDGMEKLLRPGRCIGIPAQELAMVCTIALRFVPTLLQETERIVKAQLARGASLDRGGPLVRIKALLPIIIPLFISAFRHAEDLALAMEARCYCGGQGRTRLHELNFKLKDALALILCAAFFAVLKIGEYII